MIVPAVRRYLSEEEINALRPGDLTHTDSHLGGSFRVSFEGFDGDKLIFKNRSQGWEEASIYRYTMDEVRKKIYDLVPENPAFRQSDTTQGC